MIGGGKTPQSLLVVRLGAMGDVVHAMSAVASLRASLPQMRIGWVIEERWMKLLCANERCVGSRNSARPLVDCVHVVNTKTWRRSPLASETRMQIRNAFAEMRSKHYDLAADFQGAIKSALVARFAGARTVVGMANPREAPARVLYKRCVDTRGAHVVEQYHSLAEAIAGTQLASIQPEFPLDDQAESGLTAKLGEVKDPLVVLSPGAGWAAKQWPPERFGQVARTLAQDGMKPVINFGPGEEELARLAEVASSGAAITLSCSIEELITLLRRARLFIGGDTGPMHLAAALKIPVVAIFGPTDPARNGPYGTRSVVLRNPASRTSLSHTSMPDAGLLQTTPGDVINAARQLLEACHN